MYLTSHKHDIVHDFSIIKHLLLSCFVSTVRSERECGLAALLQKNHPQWLWPTNTIFSVTLTIVPLLFKTTDGTRDVNPRLWCQRVHHPPRPPPCGSETRLHSLIKKTNKKVLSEFYSAGDYLITIQLTKTICWTTNIISRGQSWDLFCLHFGSGSVREHTWRRCVVLCCVALCDNM